MTLPKRKSRAIVVDGTTYRWLRTIIKVEPPMVSLIVHADREPSDSTAIISMYAHEGDVSTPGIAAYFIKEARKAGWDPDSKGQYVPSIDTVREWIRAYVPPSA